ncbi:hypothetical protein CHR28_33285 [Streptomyces sp. XY006]|nr:hypothetical protein CHR28_33285 [Streptomyces sp. XY006]
MLQNPLLVRAGLAPAPRAEALRNEASTVMHRLATRSAEYRGVIHRQLMRARCEPDSHAARKGEGRRGSPSVVEMAGNSSTNRGMSLSARS